MMIEIFNNLNPILVKTSIWSIMRLSLIPTDFGVKEPSRHLNISNHSKFGLWLNKLHKQITNEIDIIIINRKNCLKIFMNTVKSPIKNFH